MYTVIHNEMPFITETLYHYKNSRVDQQRHSVGVKLTNVLTRFDFMKKLYEHFYDLYTKIAGRRSDPRYDYTEETGFTPLFLYMFNNEVEYSCKIQAIFHDY